MPMDLNEAVAIIKRRSGSMHENVAAGAYVHSYYTTEGKHLTRPVFTTDAVRHRTRDEGYAESMQGRPSQTEMGHAPNRPDKLAGAAIVARMRGPSSAYSIIDDGGDAVILFHGEIDNMDPGEGNVVTADRRAINAKVAAAQARNRAWASSISDFWQGRRNHAA
jgi:hypothetical protein